MPLLCRGCCTCGLVALLAWTLLPYAGQAQQSQGAMPEKVRFETFDRADLQGSFYAGPRGNKSPCVLLLHPIGGSSQQEGWNDLSKELQQKGFAVLSFDFRGHGSSTTVDPTFWSLDAGNRTLRSFKPEKVKTTIGYKDFTSLSNYATLVNDIAAAKRFLDRKNDSGECNSANLILIGAESGATLGALWIATEWKRTRMTSITAATQGQVEGKDITGAVWLSISSTLGNHSVRVGDWLRSPVRENVPMFFLYGDGDTRSATLAKHLCDNVLKANRSKDVKHSTHKALAGTKLAGRELLGKRSLGTEELIVKYLDKVLEDRPSNAYIRREVDKTLLYRVPFESFVR